ncbi:MAG: transporter ATP-binding protein [Acidimicrobiales bacterium]|jgi:ABC-type polysaccharide/polyol phosphate transport system ATPase subunit|nr:transporter ATP-binding protein [Acidimicrobiales bacterium]
MANPIEVEHLWEGFRPRNKRGTIRRRGAWHWALTDITLSIEAGETFGVLGPNGAGKTTLLRSLAGVLRPTRGRVETIGRVASLIDLGAGVSRDLTGHENLLIGGVLLGLSRAEVRAKYDDIVAFSGIDPAVLSKPTHTYSQGMALRIAVGVVLYSDPAVLLVDEILAAADERFRARCIRRIDELRTNGTAVVLVSHDLALIETVATRAGVLHKGQFRHVDTAVETVAQYREWAKTAPADAVRPRGGWRRQVR